MKKRSGKKKLGFLVRVSIWYLLYVAAAYPDGQGLDRKQAIELWEFLNNVKIRKNGKR